ncbi:hypothetical protein NHG29_01560 [Aerococcaceae bacterium NML160702]|nr:hypothetical protein [Aerococcaceae bacterium NML190073]MCW6681551.1 hypothetical protein [Aerococcaceae bacterium NML160702]
MSKFNDFRFAGLDAKKHSNKYLTMRRISEDGNKIVVKVGDNHLIKTKYGYALIVDEKHVVFIKEWQVSENYYGNEVVLDRNFWSVKQWGQHDAFIGIDEKEHDFDTWASVAKIQEESGNEVRWS